MIGKFSFLPPLPLTPVARFAPLATTHNCACEGTQIPKGKRRKHKKNVYMYMHVWKEMGGGRKKIARDYADLFFVTRFTNRMSSERPRGRSSLTVRLSLGSSLAALEREPGRIYFFVHAYISTCPRALALRSERSEPPSPPFPGPPQQPSATLSRGVIARGLFPNQLHTPRLIVGLLFLTIMGALIVEV